jgi:hypothetical protein
MEPNLAAFCRGAWNIDSKPEFGWRMELLVVFVSLVQDSPVIRAVRVGHDFLAPIRPQTDWQNIRHLDIGTQPGAEPVGSGRNVY